MMPNLLFFLHFLTRGTWPQQYTTLYYCLFIEVFLEAPLFFPLTIWNSYLSFSHLVYGTRSFLPLLPISQRTSWETVLPLALLCVGALCSLADNAWGCTSLKASVRAALSRFPFALPVSRDELSAAVRVKYDLLLGLHLACWTAFDLITAHCVHTHKPISTLQDKQQTQILFVRSDCYPCQPKAWPWY